jgi:hypothetical protein
MPIRYTAGQAVSLTVAGSVALASVAPIYAEYFDLLFDNPCRYECLQIPLHHGGLPEVHSEMPTESSSATATTYAAMDWSKTSSVT